MDDTTLDEFYEQQEMDFSEVYAIVKYKMLNDIPMLTAKEELMEDFIKQWSDFFGSKSALGV